MASNKRTFTVALDGAAIAMIPNARRRLFVIAPAYELRTCAEVAIEIWRGEA